MFSHKIRLYVFNFLILIYLNAKIQIFKYCERQTIVTQKSQSTRAKAKHKVKRPLFSMGSHA